MKLSYLSYMHGAFLIGAIFAAVFMGMVLTYKIETAYQHGQNAGEAIGRFQMLVTLSPKQLSELDI